MKDSSKIFNTIKSIPKKASGRPISLKYPFKTLEIGDYFVAGLYGNILRSRINNNIYYYSKSLNRKFAVRKIKSKLLVYRTK